MAMRVLLTGVSRAAMLLPLAFASASMAQNAAPAVQQAPPVQSEELSDSADASDDIVVTGFRSSLRNALVRKRDADQVVDSIVAEDIGKLPDNNIAEALQRVPGVQITRNRGEGSGISIRGLTQTSTRVNGRITPGLSLEATPAEILSAIDVYKNPSSALIEGGLGGVVDLRTRRPFDFSASTISATVRGNYFDMSEELAPVFSALASTRFDTGIGEIGVLLNGAYIETSTRQDQIGVEPFNLRYNVVDRDGDGFFPGDIRDPGDGVLIPAGGGGSIEAAQRKRYIAGAAVQWRPASNLDVLLEGLYYRYDFKQDTNSPFANRGRLLPAPGAAFTFADGTNVVTSGVFRDVSFGANSTINDTLSNYYQAASNVRWKPTDALTIVGDVSYTASDSALQSNSLRIGNADPVVNGPTLSFDTRGSLPVLTLGNPPTTIDQFFFINSQNSRELFSGDSLSAQFDARYAVGGFLDAVAVGARYERLTQDRERGTDNRITSPRPPLRVLPQAFLPSRYRNFFQGTGNTNLLDLPFAPASLTRNLAAQCSAFGDTQCAEVFNPIDTYAQEQQVYAAYAQADLDFSVGSINVTGNAGARWVRTKVFVNGFRRRNDGSAEPLDQTTEYDNFLPSANLRAEVADGLFLRLAAARQLTRPGLGQLAPNLTLSIQTAVGLTGSAGNPDLRPLTSDSFDASLEYYFTPTAYAYASGFLKNVDGFIQTVTSEEAINLPDFPGFTTALITRPQNGDNGKIRGVEVGAQGFFDFLPAPFDGLGAQLNYTYVNSESPGPIAGQSVPLVGLSKNAVNAVGFFEKGGFRARIAYNWRDDYVETTSGPGSGALPIFVKPIGFLDASIGYSFSENIDLTIDASNLTRARLSSYFGETIRPRFTNIFDRRIGVAVRVRM
jgi:TonB-dependent receptor